MKKYTKSEWISEGIKRFGQDFSNWKFKCPHCGNVASGKEFRDLGVEDPNVMYLECIGNYDKTKGCDWKAYGFLNSCTVTVDDQPVFDFGE